ncbi:uncharacterized protein METZ01_LOCUS239967, partial [marine metagenome]
MLAASLHNRFGLKGVVGALPLATVRHRQNRQAPTSCFTDRWMVA